MTSPEDPPPAPSPEDVQKFIEDFHNSYPTPAVHEGVDSPMLVAFTAIRQFVEEVRGTQASTTNHVETLTWLHAELAHAVNTQDDGVAE
jgi:hypothetical protein